MSAATTSGFETKIAWLPAASVTVAPARFAIDRCATGGIIRSVVATTLGLAGGVDDVAAGSLRKILPWTDATSIRTLAA